MSLPKSLLKRVFSIVSESLFHPNSVSHEMSDGRFKRCEELVISLNKANLLKAMKGEETFSISEI